MQKNYQLTQKANSLNDFKIDYKESFNLSIQLFSLIFFSL